jgi:hypothetical protein
MTRTNHRLHTLKPARRTPAAYSGDHPMSELAYFDYAFHTQRKLFGKREPSGLTACASNCGHPACKQSCTLIGQMGLDH